MSEKEANIRVSKVFSELNIKLDVVNEYLTKVGKIHEKLTPNSKITQEQYDALSKEFKKDKDIKDQSKKIDIGIDKKEKLTIEKEEVAKPEPAPVIPKKITPPPPEKVKQETPPVAKVPEVTPKENIAVSEKQEEILLPQTPPEKPAEIQKIQEPVQSEEQIIPQAVEEEKPEEVISFPTQKPVITGPKVIGKIDVDKPKTPKSKSEKPTPTPQEPLTEISADINKSEVIQETKQEDEPINIIDVAPEQPETISEPEPEITTENQPVDEVEQTPAPEDNVIKAQAEKLQGLKLMGKINLDDFKKPEKTEKIEKTENKLVKKNLVASSQEDKIKKKKRKRISNEPSSAQKNREPFKKQKDKPKPVQEISDDEIQKQIKETLAKLTSSQKSKSSKIRKTKRENLQQNLLKEIEEKEKQKNILKVTEFLTANDLAMMMNVPVNQVISTCLNLGLFVSINQRLDAEAITLVADEFGFDVDFVGLDDDEAEEVVVEKDEDLIPRHPVVTVMGHVDHGKTSLLDYIRKTNVIAGEAGGITQHIGAYEVQLSENKKITFLDTPGHEAFTAMRARGAKLTDIAIIVISADDRVMPQTIEAINHARAAAVPMIFAINKIDKPNANPEKIKEELSAMNILVEDWGGKFQCQEISAKHGKNIEILLEKILFEAELLDLKANPNRSATGSVIESSLDKGRGYISKVLVQNGTIQLGDIVVAGTTHGKVKAMFNERNQAVTSAGPSSPVLLLGLDGAPKAGDKFSICESEREAKSICAKREQLIREQGLRTQKHITLDEIGRRIAIGDFKELNIIVKADVDGSVEALSDSLLKLSTNKIKVNVIHKSVGQINEADITLASASDAIIVGFQVRPSLEARKLAEAEQIDIRTYSVIYDAIEEVKAAMIGMLAPTTEEKIVGNIEIRDIFKISKVGTVAGCMVLDGKISRNTKVRIIRDGIVVYNGGLSTLKRFKDDVKDVSAGFECGLSIENFNDLKVGDIIEGYDIIEVKSKL